MSITSPCLPFVCSSRAIVYCRACMSGYPNRMTSFKPDTSSTYKEEAHKRVEVVRGLYLNHTRSTKVGKRVLAWVYILLGTKVLISVALREPLTFLVCNGKVKHLFQMSKTFYKIFCLSVRILAQTSRNSSILSSLKKQSTRCTNCASLATP